MPLDWPRVKAGLDPKSFTLRTVPALYARTKPWGDYDAVEQRLAPAIKKLSAARS